MKIDQLIKLLLVFFICLLTTFQSSALILQFQLSPKQHVTLFFGGEKLVRLKNDGVADSILRFDINISTNTEVRYAVGFTEGGELKQINHTMLLAPSDSLIFKKVGNDIFPINKDIKSVFLDSSIEAGYQSLSDSFRIPLSSLEEFIKYQNIQKDKFIRDSIIVYNQYEKSILSEQQKNDWLSFLKIGYHAKIFRVLDINKEKFNFLEGISLIQFNEAMKAFKTSYIKGDLTSRALDYLIKYWLVTNKSSSSELDFIHFYENNNEKIDIRYIYDGMLGYINNVTDKSSKKYLQNFERIKMYAKKYDKNLYEKCIPFRFFDMSKVYVQDINNKSYTFDEISFLKGKKYLLIDFWASWCVPCRVQMPAFHDRKKELNTSNIAFINISTEDNADEWFKALEKEKLQYDSNQYRIINFKKSLFFSFFNIQTIPRYLIIENSGKVVSERFHLPTDPEFKPELLKILSQ